MPVITITGPAAPQAEGDTGTTTFTFTVSRSGSTSGTSSVSYTVAGTGTNPADLADFASGSPLSGTVTFTAGQTSRTINVSVAGDRTVETAETFAVTLSSPSGASLGTNASAVATIANDDALGNDTLADLPGDATTTGQLQLGVASAGNINPHPDTDWYRLDVVAGRQYTVKVDGGPGTGVLDDTSLIVYAADGTTVLGRDASGNTSFIADSVVTFTATQSGTVFVAVGAVTFFGPKTGSYSVLAELTPTVVSIADNNPFIAEGNDGNTLHLLTIRRTGDLSGTSSVDYMVRNVSPEGEALGVDASDFNGGRFPQGTVTFAPGESVIDVGILIAGDTVVERDETYAVVLTNPVGTALGTANAIRVISNDDSPANQAPQTNAASASGAEDATGIPVSLSGSDADGTVASFVIKSLPTNGVLKNGTTTLSVGDTVSATANAASVSFVSAPNFNGTASFTYAAKDNNNLEDASAATASLTVTPVNDAPVAVDDVASTGFGQTVSIDVLANDTDVDNANNGNAGLSIKAGSLSVNASQGTAVINNGRIDFTPAAGFAGVATIGYTVTDSATPTAGEDIGEVKVTVAANQAPETNAASASGAEDATGIPVSLSGSDADGTVASFVIKSLPTNGVLKNGTTTLSVGDTVSATANAASVSFVSAPNFNGTASFTYAAKDNNNLEDASAATATVMVTPVNDAPVAIADTGTTDEDTPATFDVLANDTDADNLAPAAPNAGLSILAGSLQFNAAQGTASITADNRIGFTPVVRRDEIFRTAPAR